MLLIVSRLGTAIGMGPSVDTRHAASDIVGDYPCQRFGHAVDTAHGGDDPDLIADAHAALAPEPPEGPGGGRGFLYRSDGGGGDGSSLREVADRGCGPSRHMDGLGSVANGKAVFHYAASEGISISASL